MFSLKEPELVFSGYLKTQDITGKAEKIDRQKRKISSLNLKKVPGATVKNKIQGSIDCFSYIQ